MQHYKTIILADDDQDDILFFNMAIKQVCPDCKLIPLPDGEELVNYISNEISAQPDLLIIDGNMPKMNGFDAIHYIRKHLKLNIPIVMCSTSKNETCKEKAYKAGANYYITKPRTIEKLKQEINVVLNKINNGNSQLQIS